MISNLIILLFSVTFALSLAMPLAAQEANILGLPAIPQPRPGGTPPATTTKSGPGASSAKGASPGTVANRDAIGGELGIQHSAREGVGRIIVTTRTIFATAGARSEAVDTGKFVQKELVNACAKQCQPQKMTAPKILSSGQLEFELVFAPLHQNLNQAQFLAALQGRPMNLTPVQLQAPAVAPIQVQVQSTAATSSIAVGSSTTSQ